MKLTKKSKTVKGRPVKSKKKVKRDIKAEMRNSMARAAALERKQAAQAFRDVELRRLEIIEMQMQQILNSISIMDRSLVKLASELSPMVNDLRRDNASLLLRDPVEMPERRYINGR
jgi:hypothetical protein